MRLEIVPLPLLLPAHCTGFYFWFNQFFAFALAQRRPAVLLFLRLSGFPFSIWNIFLDCRFIFPSRIRRISDLYRFCIGFLRIIPSLHWVPAYCTVFAPDFCRYIRCDFSFWRAEDSPCFVLPTTACSSIMCIHCFVLGWMLHRGTVKTRFS